MAATSYFELHTARDMLEKARREHERLVANFDIDNVFNFFVTAWHVQDYILKTNAVPQSKVEAFVKDADIQYARDLCNKGKHLSLTNRPDPSTDMHFGNAIAGMAVDEALVTRIAVPSWLAGFITAYNMQTPDTYSILGNSDMQSALMWVENYCKSNPLKDLSGAANALAKELYLKRHRTRKEGGR